MMVRNASAFLPRALGSVIDHIDELVITDTGSDDNTKDILSAFWKEHGRGRRLEILDCNSKTHPDDWLLDTEASYAGGDFQVLSPFSQALILINWQRPRQLAQDASRSDFITYMDADDIFTEAHKFPKLTAHMEEQQYDLALTPYLYRRNETGIVKAFHFRASTGRRSATRWISPYHETWRVEDPAKIASYDKPITIDINDHKDPVNRVANRGTKILAHAYFTGDHSAHTTFKLAQEIGDSQPDVATELYRKAIPGLSSIPHKAIGMVRLGSLLESSQHQDQARTLYNEAFAIFPYCPEAAFGLARIALAEGQYEQSVEWSKAGAQAAKHDASNLLVYNPIARYGHSRIIHAMALSKLGHHREALIVHDEGKEILPGDFAELRYFLDKAREATP
jgi:glycosyltransferase involved in cell wall biosynthesis